MHENAIVTEIWIINKEGTLNHTWSPFIDNIFYGSFMIHNIEINRIVTSRIPTSHVVPCHSKLNWISIWMLCDLKFWTALQMEVR